jgi:hypothetical protein
MYFAIALSTKFISKCISGITKKCYLDAIMAAIEEAKKTLPEIIVR